MVQCATGTPKVYGPESDLKYENNADWNSRRDSLQVGGRLLMGPAHLLISLRKTPFSDAAGGNKFIDYYQLDDWMYSELSEHFDDDMMESVALEIFRQLFIEYSRKVDLPPSHLCSRTARRLLTRWPLRGCKRWRSSRKATVTTGASSSSASCCSGWTSPRASRQSATPTSTQSLS